MRTEEPQTQNSVKNIFVDLDETLIHTDLTNGDMPNEVPSVDVNISPSSDKPDIYQVSLRPGALDLLFSLREIGYVYMLTRATHDYAVAMNKTFNLAFTENRIYSRKDVRKYRYKELHLPQGKNYIIDDLHQIDNYEKVTLVSQLGPVHYIRIGAFYGFKSEGLTSGSISDIVKSIKAD